MLDTVGEHCFAARVLGHNELEGDLLLSNAVDVLDDLEVPGDQHVVEHEHGEEALILPAVVLLTGGSPLDALGTP